MSNVTGYLTFGSLFCEDELHTLVLLLHSKLVLDRLGDARGQVDGTERHGLYHDAYRPREGG